MIKGFQLTDLRIASVISQEARENSPNMSRGGGVGSYRSWNRSGHMVLV